MGIKHFWKWFRTNFETHITQISYENIKEAWKKDAVLPNSIDNLMIDLNGIFHGSTQFIYQYGANSIKSKPSILNPNRIRKITYKYPLNTAREQNYAQKAVFRHICKHIDKIISIVKPKKRVILCIDGPAPLSKQNQQRQRRFKSAKEKCEEEFKRFDSNCLTPGTRFMDYLSKYIDNHIRKRLSQSKTEKSDWKGLEVIFSNEKVAGEGEAKCISWLRNHGIKSESFCIHGMDADLIMLSLGTHYPNFWILRDDMYQHGNAYFFINIGSTRVDLSEKLKFDNDNFSPVSAIDDFIGMCFAVGNDFLPHIPSIEIIQGSIDTMIDVYINIGEEYGHLTEYKQIRHSGQRALRFRKKSLCVFLGTIAQYAKGTLEDKANRRDNYIRDPILDVCTTQTENGSIVDLEKYRKLWYKDKFPMSNLEDEDNLEDLCHHYIEGMQWVLSYYTYGVPHWKWRFPYHFAPFAIDLAKYLPQFNFSVYGHSIPTPPFIQLLCVLPPKSYRLIPSPLDSLVKPESPLSKYYPDDFEVDTSGCRQEWEGTVILPLFNIKVIENEYYKLIQSVHPRDLVRNKSSFPYIYENCNPYCFKSYYGDINACTVKSVRYKM